MTQRAAPLRFLVLVLGGWTLARGVILIGDARDSGMRGFDRAVARLAETLVPEPALADPAGLPEPTRAELAAALPVTRNAPAPRSVSRVVEAPTSSVVYAEADLIAPAAAPPSVSREHAAPPSIEAPLGLALPPARPDRWSGSAWALIRDDGAPPLATGGLLGGSQIGARLSYRLNDRADRPITLTARVSTALSRPAGAEAALGIEWQPSAAPVRLLAERRQSLGDGGRSAFALLAYGGVYDRAFGPARLEAYAQAGVVGARSRDLFVDGAVRAGVPVDGTDRLRIGGGLWGAAQPGAERLDVGPQLSYRVPVKDTNLRLLADWRFRIAGDAAPASGPALTLAADF
ncbi:hypothetical protein [Allosphingosinicella indica]|uniref:Uncharacterized protein n=1 Tax=Allosphingosinicella indica TaxID=941907 RepID=A0A1X7G0G9_9SPHN|nr:hypothetical protein [Allosphingosinicella indica]SMF61851.1 hypothetical protein SAMN06295910_0851 [Allosphingosinicella indica]